MNKYKPENSAQRWVTAVVTHPKTSILCSLLLCLVFIAGLLNFQFAASPRGYQGEGSKHMQQLIALEQAYTQDNNLLVMFKVESGTVFEPQTLAAIKSFTDAAWQLPYVQRVDSLTNFQYSHAEGDDLLVGDFIADPLSLTPAALNALAGIARSEPRLQGYLLARDNMATAVNMNFNIDLEDLAAMKSLEAEVDALIRDTLERHPHLSAYKSGYLGACFGWLAAMEIDLNYLFTSAMVIIFLGLWLFFRSLSLGSATMLLGILSVLAAAGSVGIAGQEIQATAAVGLLLVLMLALADSIHIVQAVRRLLAQGKSRQEAIVESVASNVKPIIITSVTTAIGFLSFFTSEYEGTRVMGGYVAFGVMLALVLTFTLLPALMNFCYIRPAASLSVVDNKNRLADVVIRLRWLILAMTVSSILVSIHFIRQEEINDNVIHYMSESMPFRQDLPVVERHLTGSMDVMLELSSGEEQGVSDPQFMAQVDVFASWLRQQPDVRFVSAYTDTMKRLNQNMFGDDPAQYRLPGDKELAAQYLLLYELSLPYGLDLTNQINMDKSATRISLTVNDMPASQLIPLTEKMQEWLKSNAPDIIPSNASGSTITTTLLSLDTFYSMLDGSGLGLLVIALILFFAFRSFMPGLLCVIMVVSPIVVTFGIWSLIADYFEATVTIALCMVIGIVVDNAVHFISKYLKATKELGLNREDAIRYTFNTVGGALVTNTLVLGAGFGILLFSGFRSNGNMGMLTVLTLFTALAGTFTLLPCLLLMGKNKAIPAPDFGQQELTGKPI